MKSIQNLVFLFFLILIISACGRASDFQPDGNVIIAGKMLNFEKHLEFKNFNLYYHTGVLILAYF